METFNIERFNSSNESVSKFVFTKNDACVEAVLYRYPDFKTRTVLCVSTQCGCRIGCVFCGTGKHFVRNLTTSEIVEQVTRVMELVTCKPKDIRKFQIMFMSMGEPFLNYGNVAAAIEQLATLYPNAQLLVSTSSPFPAMSFYLDDFCELSNRFPQIGLQFSVHESTDHERKKLVPNYTMSLQDVATIGKYWSARTGRKPFLNYCVKKSNSRDQDVNNLRSTFEPIVWEVTLSVICNADESMAKAYDTHLDEIRDFANKMTVAGYSTRVFNPGGTDDVGGGCGQLWQFQKFIKQLK